MIICYFIYYLYFPIILGSLWIEVLQSYIFFVIDFTKYHIIDDIVSPSVVNPPTIELSDHQQDKQGPCGDGDDQSPQQFDNRAPGRSSQRPGML